MQLLAFIIIYPVLWLISLLPLKILYIFSDILYFLAYRVVKYRKKTVRLNLKLALPELTEEERRQIEKKFYRHFCDTLVEMIKTLTISEKEVKKRFVFTNIELINELEKQGKSFVVLIAHYGNYEWLLLVNKYLTTHKGFGIYKRINNKYFDKLVKKIRGRFNAELIDTKQTIPVMKQNQRNNILGCYGFITDQSPKIHRVPYWGNFFNMEVPIHVGGEIMAKKLNMNVVFVKGEKIKRGYYSATFIPYEKNVQETPNFEITDSFLRMLEQQIRECPEYYLWTHKRFKHSRGFYNKTN